MTQTVLAMVLLAQVVVVPQRPAHGRETIQVTVATCRDNPTLMVGGLAKPVCFGRQNVIVGAAELTGDGATTGITFGWEFPYPTTATYTLKIRTHAISTQGQFVLDVDAIGGCASRGAKGRFWFAFPVPLTSMHAKDAVVTWRSGCAVTGFSISRDSDHADDWLPGSVFISSVIVDVVW